jgi:hypothetical protein
MHRCLDGGKGVDRGLWMWSSIWDECRRLLKKESSDTITVVVQPDLGHIIHRGEPSHRCSDLVSGSDLYNGLEGNPARLHPGLWDPHVRSV